MMMLRALILLAFFALPALAEKPAKFHPPQTEAERALDKIVMHSEGAATVMTKALTDDIEKQEKALVDKTCDGREECGFSYDPVICAQDHPDTFLYRVVKQSDNEVILTYTWPEYLEAGTAKDGPLYRMIRVKGGWVLDGIHCGTVGRFNME